MTTRSAPACMLTERTTSATPESRMANGRGPGQDARNVLYVATTKDRVYAFDADRAGPPLWMRNLTDEMAGVTPVPVTDITNSNDLNLVGNTGIVGTPVIDRTVGAIYLVARTRENGRHVQHLYKL